MALNPGWLIMRRTGDKKEMEGGFMMRGGKEVSDETLQWHEKGRSRDWMDPGLSGWAIDRFSAGSRVDCWAGRL